MAADLFVRILFKSDEYDRSINESRRKTREFQSDMERSSGGFQKFGSMANAAAGMVGKLAGGLGLAMGAMEVFDKAINSNAQLQDKYQTLIGTSKMVTDQFFSAIYSGDWTIFNDGIEKAIENAEDYIAAYRNTQRMLQSTAIDYERTDARKNQLEAIVEDDTRPLEERKKAQAELDRILIMGVADIREASTRLNDTLNQMIRTSAGSNRYVNAENAQETILNLYNPYSSLRQEIEEYRKVRDLSAQTAGNSLRGGFDLTTKFQQMDAKKVYDLYTDEQKARNDELLRIVDSMNEATFASYRELFDQINDLNDKAGTWEKDRFGARDEILSAREEMESAAAEAIRKVAAENENIIPEGSILELQKRISDLTDNFQKAADDGTRAGFQKAIDEAETQLEMMRLRAAGTSVLSDSITAPEGRNATDDINSGYISIKPISSDTIQSNYDYADSIGAIGNIMSSVTSLTNEGSASWLSYAANVIQAVGQALPKLSALATQNAAVAATGAASSVASIPVVGWIMAAGAVASVIAAMSNVPKFANGGIVPGNMFTGDRVPAMLNSGEMILNRTQQGNLFRILNEGGTGGRNDVNVKGEVVVDVNVKGEVVVSGDQMRILLANTERKRSRGR